MFVHAYFGNSSNFVNAYANNCSEFGLYVNLLYVCKVSYDTGINP